MFTLPLPDARAIADKATTTWTFDAYSGRMTAKRYQGTGGTATPDLAYTYWSSGRLYTRTGGRGIITTYTYDSAGDLNSVVYDDSVTPCVSMDFDRLGRMVMVDDAAGMHTLTYSDEGQPLTETYADDTGMTGAVGLNLLSGITVTNTYAQPSGMSYGTVRSAHAVTKGSSTYNSVAFEHNADARLSRVVKSGGDALFTYDSVTGQQIGTTYRFNDSGTTYSPRIYGHHLHNRLGQFSEIQWEWHATVTPPATSVEYDIYNRYYGTDIYGRRTTAASSAGFETNANWAYGYDDIGQLTSASASFAYTDPVVHIPGSQFAYAYDDIGNRTGITQGSDGDTYTSGYTRNPLNQYTARDVSGNVEVSGHSPATAVTVNGTTADRYDDGEGFFHTRLNFDNSANPQKETIEINEYPGTLSSYNMLIAAASQNFTYDADGNLTADDMWTYTWDAENRLTGMQLIVLGSVDLGFDPSLLIRLTFAYDWMGRRISKKFEYGAPSSEVVSMDGAVYVWTLAYCNKYVYDIGSWNLSVSTTCDARDDSITGADQSFAWGPDLSGTENGAGGIGGLAIYQDNYIDGGGGSGVIGPMFPLYDGNGNVMRLYDSHVASNGLIDHKRADYTYGPFGEARGQTGTQAARFPFRFSTKFTDNETGLDYYGYRYYSPSLGRWINRDPVGEIGGRNIVAYVGNEPIKHTDPRGLWRFDDEMGDLGGTLGPAINAPTTWGQVLYGAYFNMRFNPDHAAFQCRDCQEVRFVQIIRQDVKQFTFLSDALPGDASGVSWQKDPPRSAQPPYYELGDWYDPKIDSSHMQDDPGLQVIFRHPFVAAADVETCAICSSGGSKGEVYGCLKWGYWMKKNGASIPWRLYFGSRTFSAAWGTMESTVITQPGPSGVLQNDDLDATFFNQILRYWHVKGTPPSPSMINLILNPYFANTPKGW